jgi:hypothetical protein
MERFNYDSSAGRLVYKIPPCQNQPQRVGQFAGGKHSEGGWIVSFKNSCYLHCRLVWMFVYGVDPEKMEIDHINGDRSDDRIDNLRLATRQQQQWNVAATASNTSGYKGVGYYKRTGKWRAYIRKDNINKSLGYFNTKEDAYAAYVEASKQLHGDFHRVKQ